MKKETSLILAAIVFSAVAILHLLRYLLLWELTINSYSVPQWASILGTIIPAILAYHLFKLRGEQ
jgi:hypothetical protein